jgi:CelD/BcsL family acetyltransferase involved in cellulose biosynthesis
MSNESGPLLLPFHLTLEGRVLATMLGGRYDSTFWALVSSLASGEECKHSPGDLALRRMIEECCALDLEWIDFAPGETDYKPRWADVTVELHEIIQAVTWRGLGWALAALASARAKALVKQSPLLWRAARSLRAALGRRYARKATLATGS